MLLSPEISQSLRGRRSLSMRKVASRHAIARECRGSGGVGGPIMFHYDYPVNWGEPAVSCNYASMTYNDKKKKEIKWTAGSRISA